MPESGPGDSRTPSFNLSLSPTMSSMNDHTCSLSDPFLSHLVSLLHTHELCPMSTYPHAPIRRTRRLADRLYPPLSLCRPLQNVHRKGYSSLHEGLRVLALRPETKKRRDVGEIPTLLDALLRRTMFPLCPRSPAPASKSTPTSDFCGGEV